MIRQLAVPVMAITALLLGVALPAHAQPKPAVSIESNPAA